MSTVQGGGKKKLRSIGELSDALHAEPRRPKPAASMHAAGECGVDAFGGHPMRKHRTATVTQDDGAFDCTDQHQLINEEYRTY